MTLVAFLVNLLVAGLFIWAVVLLVNWISGLIGMPAVLKTVVLIIIAIIVVLWLAGLIPILPRIRI